jgi:hypothetical protein
MSEEFLDGPDIITILQEMSSKTVPKRMTARRLRDLARPNGVLDSVLQVSLRDMVPTCLAAPGIDGDFVGREDILPRPFTGRIRIFPVQGAGKINRAAAVSEVLLMEFLDPGEVRLQRTGKPLRQNGNAFPHPLSFSNGDLAISKIDILDAKPKTFEQAQTAAVKEVCHNSVISLQMGENGPRFGSREDDGKLRRAANALDRNKFELPVEHLLEEKEKRAQSLVLGGRGDVSHYREISKEGSDLLLAHFVWMAFTMEENEAPDPINVSRLGADAVVLDPQMPTNAIEQLGR